MKSLLKIHLAAALVVSFTGCLPPSGTNQSGDLGDFQTGGGGGNKNGNPTSTPTPSPTVITGPKSLYEISILPKFTETCAGCHRIGGQGQLTIFNYESAKQFVLDGGGTQTNKMMRYMRAQDPYPHTGINYCNGFPQVCDAIVQWRIAEGGNSDVNEPAVGDVTGASKINGIYVGWVVDPNSPAAAAQVNVYVDGTAAGNLLTTLTANQPLTGVAFSGNHGFQFQVPMNLRNGVSHTYYFYGVDMGGGDPTLLSRGTITAALFAPTAEGRNYYTGTVQPMLIMKCGGCHGTGYQGDYARMSVPYPSDPVPGRADDNNLINKARGVNHNGGNICGPNGVNGSPCLELQNWWNLEY